MLKQAWAGHASYHNKKFVISRYSGWSAVSSDDEPSIATFTADRYIHAGNSEWGLTKISGLMQCLGMET